MFLLGCQLKKAFLRGQSLDLFLCNVFTNDLFCFMGGVSINTESFRKLSTINFQWTKTLYQHIKEYCDKSRLNKYNSTWSHENRVSKHFVIFLNFPCLIACLLCCLLMSFFLLVLWLGICVEVDVDRITILTSPSPPDFFPYPQFFL